MQWKAVRDIATFDRALDNVPDDRFDCLYPVLSNRKSFRGESPDDDTELDEKA